MKRFLLFICLVANTLGVCAQDMSYEDLEKMFISINSQLPLSLGPSMEFNSMSINHKEATFVYTAIDFYQGLSPLTEKEMKESCKVILAGMDEDMTSLFLQIAKLDIGLCLTVIGENSNKNIHVHFSPEELYEIANSSSDPKTKLELYVNTQKKALPFIMGNGMTFVDIRINKQTLESVIELDENIGNVDNIKDNMSFIKDNTISALSQDLASVFQLFLCLECGYTYTMTYIGNSSRKSVSIVFNTKDLQQIINNE